MICNSIDPLIHLSIWAIIFQLLSCLTNLFCIPTYVAITNECIYISPFLTILCKYPSYALKSYVCTLYHFQAWVTFSITECAQIPVEIDLPIVCSWHHCTDRTRLKFCAKAQRDEINTKPVNLKSPTLNTFWEIATRVN